jgi:glycosyltransferase involved in cell wall biosynthesis
MEVPIRTASPSMSLPEHIATFKQLGCCVLMPTYNNAGTLRKVIQGVLDYCDDVIVVNDGSTDGTAEILKDFPQVRQLHFPENQGKGAALRAGFKEAREHGFRYAITIDSDGQHYPEDLPIFLEELKQHISPEGLLLIGARNMGQTSVPRKSSFGNRFSNFWYWVETGIKLKDTQSGFRAYPLGPMERIPFWSARFEFEIEVIVRAAWDGVTVRNIPVRVKYDIDERVSHFRPGADFGRISVMNTLLVLMMIFYIKPRDIYAYFAQKGWKRSLREQLIGPQDSDAKKALSLGIGVFIGISPLWGLQTLIAVGAAVMFKLNRALAFAGSNVSIPPMIPVVILGSIGVGEALLGGEEISMAIDLDHIDFDHLNLLPKLKVYVVGSIALATICGVLAGLITYGLLRLFKWRAA